MVSRRRAVPSKALRAGFACTLQCRSLGHGVAGSKRKIAVVTHHVRPGNGGVPTSAHVSLIAKGYWARHSGDACPYYIPRSEERDSPAECPSSLLQDHSIGATPFTLEPSPPWNVEPRATTARLNTSVTASVPDTP
jgi:hypothetical protein